MISSDIMRGYNDILVLAMLLTEDSYGYEIAKKINKLAEDKYLIKETTLYSTFARLEKASYIASYYGSETFGRQRTYYKITNLGRSYFNEKCLEWEETKYVIDQFTKGKVTWM